MSIGNLSDRSFNNYLSILEGSSKLRPDTQLSILHSMRNNIDPRTLQMLQADLAQKVRTEKPTQSQQRLGIRTGIAKRSGPLRSSVVQNASPAVQQQQFNQPQRSRMGRRQLSAAMLPSDPGSVNTLAESFPLTTRAPLIFTPPIFG